MKFIYLIQSEEEGYYKIGISKHPNKRLLELQTGNSSPLKLIETYQSEHASLIERTLHRRYCHFHKEREWFDLSIGEEASFINDCKKIEENIKFLKKNDNVFI